MKKRCAFFVVRTEYLNIGTKFGFSAAGLSSAAVAAPGGLKSKVVVSHSSPPYSFVRTLYYPS
jgi:hypothetical protein